MFCSIGDVMDDLVCFWAEEGYASELVVLRYLLLY